jgi:hypothetical protein
MHDNNSFLKIILIISPVSKDEIMEITKANLVKGIVLKPFTKEIICKYIEKLL